MERSGRPARRGADSDWLAYKFLFLFLSDLLGLGIITKSVHYRVRLLWDFFLWRFITSLATICIWAHPRPCLLRQFVVPGVAQNIPGTIPDLLLLIIASTWTSANDVQYSFWKP